MSPDLLRSVRLTEQDQRHIDIIKKKTEDFGEPAKNTSQAIKKSLEFTSMYYPLNIKGS